MHTKLSVVALLAAACAAASAQVAPLRAPGVCRLEAEPPVPCALDLLRLRTLVPEAARLLEPNPRAGLGVVAGDRVLVTARELVEGAGPLRVRLADGHAVVASVAALGTDVAVLVASAPLDAAPPLALPRAQAWGALPGGPVLALLDSDAALPLGAPLLSADGELLGYAAHAIRVPLLGDLTLSYAWATPPTEVEPLLERAAPAAGPPDFGWTDLWGWRALAGAPEAAR